MSIHAPQPAESQDETFEEYQERLKEEGKHFSDFMHERLSKGIHEMYDVRRAEYMDCVYPHLEDDPKVSTQALGRFRDRLLSKAATKRGGQALDVGCGAGWLTLELARVGLHAKGVDIGEGSLDIARRMVEENPYKEGFGSATYEVADLNRMTFEPNSLDVIVAWNALHHFPGVDGLMERLAQALKPDGLFMLYDHGSRDWRNDLGHYGLLMFMPTHVVGLTPKERVLRIAEKVVGKVTRRPVRFFTPKLGVDWTASPFEDAGQDMWLKALEKNFEITHKETNHAFTLFSVARLRINPRLRYPIIRFLLAWDRLMIRTGLMRGEFLYIEARKPSR